MKRRPTVRQALIAAIRKGVDVRDRLVPYVVKVTGATAAKVSATLDRMVKMGNLTAERAIPRRVRRAVKTSPKSKKKKNPAPKLSYAQWSFELGAASGRHGTSIAMGPQAHAAWAKGETPDEYAKRQPVSRLAGGPGRPKKNPAPAMSATEGRRFKAEVARANERTLRALARAKVKELRAQVKAARKRGPLRTREVRALLKRTRELVRLGVRAEGAADVARAKAELEVERKDQATQKRLERANRAREKMRPLAKAKERASESDGEVEGNLPPEFVPLWHKVKKGIRGNARKSRTEAFLEYVAENPGEVIEAAPGIDSQIAELERRANSVEDFSRKAKYSAADYSAPPF